MKQLSRLVVIILAGQVAAIPLSFIVLIAFVPLLRSMEQSTGIEMIGHSGPAEWIIYSVWAMISLLITATLVASRKHSKEGIDDHQAR